MSVHNDIKKGDFAPVYLMYGAEPFFIEETIQLLLKNAISDEDKEFNIATYDAEEVVIEQAIEEAITPPFFGDRKVVIIQSASFLTGQKLKLEQNAKELEKYINSPSPFTILIVVAPYEKLDERKKITKLLKQQSVVESQVLDNNGIHKWIKERSTQIGTSIEKDAINKLVELVGVNASILSNELEKLSIYVGEGAITSENVITLVPKTIEQNIFALVENVVNRNTKLALEILHELLHRQEEPIKILGLLSSQFRLLYQVKEYTGIGYTGPQIAQRIGVHPYRVKLASGQVRNFQLEELHEIMNELAQADQSMKSSGLDKKLILEFFIMKRKK